MPIYGAGTVSLVTYYDSWQEKPVPYSSTSSTPAPVVPLDSVYGTVTAPDNGVTRFTVDRYGQPLVSSHPLGDPLNVTTTVTYNDDGLPTRIVRSNDVADTTHMSYNSDGLVTATRQSGSTETVVAYGAWAQPDSVTGNGQVTAKYWLGTNGRIDSTRIGSSAKTRYTYDSRGRVLTVKDGLNNLIQTSAYNGTNGNLSTVTLPGGRITTYGYDAYGRLTTVNQAGLPARTTYYDVINRADSVRDGVNAKATRYTHDALFLTAVTDPRDQAYAYAYNDLGWLTRRTDPVNRSDYYEYSRAGQLRRWQNRRGQYTYYAYDALQRETSKYGSNTDSTHFGYSASGRQIRAWSPAVTDSLYLTVLGAPEKVVSTFSRGKHVHALLRLHCGRPTRQCLGQFGVCIVRRSQVHLHSKQGNSGPDPPQREDHLAHVRCQSPIDLRQFRRWKHGVPAVHHALPARQGGVGPTYPRCTDTAPGV